MTFREFNDKANYYSTRTRATGENVWNQDEIQRSFIALIGKCNLTNEQLAAIDGFMVKDNATIDMSPSYNQSYNEFKNFALAKQAEASKVHSKA